MLDIGLLLLLFPHKPQKFGYPCHVRTKSTILLKYIFRAVMNIAFFAPLPFDTKKNNSEEQGLLRDLLKRECLSRHFKNPYINK